MCNTWDTHCGRIGTSKMSVSMYFNKQCVDNTCMNEKQQNCAVMGGLTICSD